MHEAASAADLSGTGSLHQIRGHLFGLVGLITWSNVDGRLEQARGSCVKIGRYAR